KADALGLGWVYMKPKNGQPGNIQKTGGGGGFITYMAMNPQANVGAFVVVTRSSLTRFNNMSDGVNELVSELSGDRPGIETASQ
ncbi:serine hydrolase, partial [Klebsiella michiganensis]